MFRYSVGWKDSCSKLWWLERFLFRALAVGKILVQRFGWLERFLFRASAGKRDSFSELWRLERFLFRASAGKRDSCSELRLAGDMFAQRFGWLKKFLLS